MRENFKQLIDKGMIEVNFTRFSKYPIVTYLGKLICESELKAHDFKGMNDFIEWYHQNYPE